MKNRNDPDQTARKRILIDSFTGRKGPNVAFLMGRYIFLYGGDSLVVKSGRSLFSVMRSICHYGGRLLVVSVVSND